MAGNDSRFDATKFRDAVTFAMNMGLPPNASDRATFRWRDVKTFNRPDPKGLPYNLTQTTLTDVVHPDVQIPVAVLIPTRAIIKKTLTPAGEINDNVRVIITVLDTYYSQVSTANTVLLGGNVYNIDYWGPPLGLFSVEIYEAFCSSVDES